MDKRHRVLINDVFGTPESVEILKFCHGNDIILCRLPSHTSHKLQPCDVGVFGPLKAAYREAVERLYRGDFGTIGKEHFTLLYDRARRKAFTCRNILAAWVKTGLRPLTRVSVIRIKFSMPFSGPVQTVTASLRLTTAKQYS